jgi:hypothetical protein
MVSRYPYPHLTKQILRGKRSLSHIVQVILAALIIYQFSEIAVALLFWVYALAMPLWSALRRSPAAKPAPTLGDGTYH